MADTRRAIPSIERLLASPALAPLLARESRARVVTLLRAIQSDVRAGSADHGEAEWYATEIEHRLRESDRPSLHEVINATGVVLHTNLGRAPLSAAALQAVAEVARGFSNLEYDEEAGARGSRYVHCETLLKTLTGAEAALVVNNNAAALILTLNTIGMNRPVIISRGELVEIGDSFRIAEIAERSGVVLREVGATNRTHLRDYEQALAGAAAILKVHPSNFKATGFVAETAAVDLAKLARGADIPLVHDLGSGLIESLDDLGLTGEPTARQALAAGAALLTMSGDKLLGGPQAGIVLGKSKWIAEMKRNPLCRALRVDKLTLAALEATLLSYARGTARVDIPVLRMLAITRSRMRERATRFAERIGGRVIDGESAVGGGAYPDVGLPTSLVVIDAPAATLEAKLRAGTPTVVARIANDRVLLDLRTVLPEQESVLASLIADAV